MTLSSIFFAPDMFEQQILGNDTSGILRQICQQPVLYGRQLDFLIGQGDAVLGKVDGQLTKRRSGSQTLAIMTGSQLRPAHDCPDTSEQFRYAEWLGEIVIGPQIQSPDLIIILPQRGHDDDGYI